MQQKAMMITSMMMMMAATMTEVVRGHGMMIDPVQRSSMFRYGYPDAPRNYDDNQLFCGGFNRQWNVHGGKCGICGDDYGDAQPRENEAGGKYANGVIVKNYVQADVIDVTVKITANHLGYFVFKLCPNNDVKKIATQACLDQHVLQVVGDNGENAGDRFVIDAQVGDKHVKLRLPSDVTCTQCVLQWTYNTGNSWGCDDNCCVGCGPQENFVNCADVAITPSGSGGGNSGTQAPTTTTATTTTVKPKVTDSPQSTQQPAETTTTTTTTTATTRTTTVPLPTPRATTKKPSGGCRPTAVYAQIPTMQSWCDTNCAVNFCPATHCTCD